MSPHRAWARANYYFIRVWFALAQRVSDDEVLASFDRWLINFDFRLDFDHRNDDGMG